MIIEHVFAESALASRHSAAKLRESLPFQSNAVIVLDFSAVESVSESFADELFGVLVAEHSLPVVFSHVALRGVRPAVASSVASAIRYRITRGEEGNVPLALVAAKEALKRQEDVYVG